MTEAFIAFVRFEEKLLLLSRSKDDKISQDLDGVWGVKIHKRKFSPDLKQQASSRHA